MAGQDRPRCKKCNKLYKFNWTTETFEQNCFCDEPEKGFDEYE